MKEFILDNGLKLIYKKGNSSLTSISIAFDAGAGVEDELYGVAHATEHMVYKGTFKRSEDDINRELSDLFGFQNAMTNYPYVIYYGTLLSEDFELGIELFSDILLHPKFSSNGFKEEMDVIKEELKEWDEDLEQFAEDKLFYNNFQKRRIKYPIIGKMEDLENLKLEDIKAFYKKFYTPLNCSICIVSDLDFSKVKGILEKYFGNFTLAKLDKKEIFYDDFKEGIFRDFRKGSSSRIMKIYPIDTFSSEDIKALNIINTLYSEGVNSILYKKLRTEKGLIYDVLPSINFENYIKLYKIGMNISKDNIEEGLSLLEECEKILEKELKDLKEEKLKSLIKSFKLKKLFNSEKSIVLAKELSTYSSMFGSFNFYEEETVLDNLKKEDLLRVYYKLIKKSSVEVIINNS